jgi:hypothetical protein
MPKKVDMAFEPEGVLLQLVDILPVKQLGKRVKKTKKYSQISASIREIGIIEPPVVVREPRKGGKFLLLDGHLRIEVLKDLGSEEVMCLVATDDEAFTYNKRINRLATIQEHKMILKAIERGVPQERIVRALDINIASLRRKRSLLEGICPETAELLKDKHCPRNTFQSLKKMTPMRQIEVTELMIAMDNYSVSYSEALLAATPQDQLIDSAKPKSFKGISAEQIAQMETEMGNCTDNAAVESFFGLLKREHVNRVRYRTRDQARADVFDYIEVFYNRKRRHGYLGNISPADFEERSDGSF